MSEMVVETFRCIFICHALGWKTGPHMIMAALILHPPEKKTQRVIVFWARTTVDLRQSWDVALYVQCHSSAVGFSVLVVEFCFVQRSKWSLEAKKPLKKRNSNPVDFLACRGTRNSNTVKGKIWHSCSEKDDFDGMDRWKFTLGESLFAFWHIFILVKNSNRNISSLIRQWLSHWLL